MNAAIEGWNETYGDPDAKRRPGPLTSADIDGIYELMERFPDE